MRWSERAASNGRFELPIQSVNLENALVIKIRMGVVRACRDEGESPHHGEGYGRD